MSKFGVVSGTSLSASTRSGAAVARGGRARAAHDEIAAVHDPTDRRGRIGDPPEQQLGGGAADVVGRLCDHGDPRIDQPGPAKKAMR